MVLLVKLKNPFFQIKPHKKRNSYAQRLHRRRRSNTNSYRRKRLDRDSYTQSTLCKKYVLHKPLIIYTDVETIDLFPNITQEVENAIAERKRVWKKYRKQKSKKNSNPTKPASIPIIPRAPDLAEIASAASHVEENFKLYDHGHVRVFDSATNKLIAAMHFTDMTEMDAGELDDYKFLCLFLHQAKKFVSPVASKGRSCAGTMWAIGWRKAMKRFEILGRYTRKANIRKFPKEYQRHIADFCRANRVLWKMFHQFSDVALQNNQEYMKKFNIPSLDTDNHTDDNSSPFNFSSNLTFTSNGFFNHAHKDEGDDCHLPFAFLISIPTVKRTGRLALPSDNYDVSVGHFIFRDCKFGVRFKPNMVCKMVFSQRDYVHGTLKPHEPTKFTKTGISLQIATKTTTACKKVLLGKETDYPETYFGGVEYSLKLEH
ncbi:hypothetical protein Pst134EB_020326 [Puccinia striiformis f. sp. tritici]|nr:hypothetical protein Pst134EB_020326 [Puccinia striiformis f. sp. tritici]